MTRSISEKGVGKVSRELAEDLFDAQNRNNGTFIGEVVEVLKSLRLRVYIRELSMSTDWKGTDGQVPYDPGFYTCEPLAASAGSVEGDSGANSYGLFGPQPKRGDRVAVLFINGTAPHWFGGIIRNDRTGMGGRDGQCSTEPSFDGPSGGPATGTVAADNLQQSGLAEDAVRGQGSADMSREDPSTLQGMKTRGDPERGEIGHQFIMDDLPAEAGIRLRTSHGHQILWSDVTDSIYISTAQGNSWVEISQDGKIDIYSSDTISAHAKKDFNLKIGENFNLDVGKNFNYSVGGDVIENITGSRTTTIGSFSKTTNGGAYEIQAAGEYAASALGISLSSLSTLKTSSAMNTEIYGGVSVNIDAGVSVNMEKGLVSPLPTNTPLPGGLNAGGILSRLGNLQEISEGIDALPTSVVSSLTEQLDILNGPLQALSAQGFDISGVTDSLSGIVANASTTLGSLTGGVSGSLSGVLGSPLNNVKEIISNAAYDNDNLFALTSQIRSAVPSFAQSDVTRILDRFEGSLDAFPINLEKSFIQTVKLPDFDEDVEGTVSQITNQITTDQDNLLAELRSLTEPQSRLTHLFERFTPQLQTDVLDLISQLEQGVNTYRHNLTKNISQNVHTSVSNSIPNLSNVINSRSTIFTNGMNNLNSNIQYQLDSAINELLGEITDPIDDVQNTINDILEKKDRAINGVLSMIDNAKADMASMMNKINDGLGLAQDVTNLLQDLPGAFKKKEFVKRAPDHEPWRPSKRIGPSIATFIETQIAEPFMEAASSMMLVSSAPLPASYQYLDDMQLPKIVEEARKLYGIRRGANDSTILGWARETGQHHYRSTSTAWCGLFMAVVTQRAGWKVVNGPLGARNWTAFGIGVNAPQLGDVVVFRRPSAGPAFGHVSLFIKDNGNGTIAVLGGNQGGKVCVANYAKSSVIAYRRPDQRGNLGGNNPMTVNDRNGSTVCEVPTSYGSVPSTGDTDTGQRILIYSGSDNTDNSISNMAEIATTMGGSVPYHYVIKRNGQIDKADHVVSQLERSIQNLTRSNTPNIRFDFKIKLNGGVKPNSSPVKYETNFTQAQYASLKTLCGELTTKYPNVRVWGAWEQGQGGETPKHPTFGANYWWRSRGNQIISYYGGEGSDDDVFWTALTLALEIGGGSNEAIACVAQVIKNRRDSNQPVGNQNSAWAGTYKGIVLANRQFSCYWYSGWGNNARSVIAPNDFRAAEKNARENLLPPKRATLSKYMDIARQVIAGTYRGGASFNAIKNNRTVTQYANPEGVTGGRRPWMAVEKIVAREGGHEFYRA